MSMSALEACPECGEKKGELVKRVGSRFPYYVICRACGWLTQFVRLPGIAEKLWNEAKPKQR
jgi:hypothetical protein